MIGGLASQLQQIQEQGLVGQGAAAEAPAEEPAAAEPPEEEAREAEPVAAAITRPELPQASSAPARQAYVVQQTHGQSVAEFFRGLLAARLPALSVPPVTKVDAAERAPAAEAEGAPTRPAHDSLSLSSVFGDEGTPTPPAVPVPAAAPSPAPADGGVSFDEFYGPPGRSDAPRQARSSDTKSDDLDQFHAWLQNLKR
jgi:hypothetical protein